MVTREAMNLDWCEKQARWEHIVRDHFGSAADHFATAELWQLSLGHKVHKQLVCCNPLRQGVITFPEK